MAIGKKTRGRQKIEMKKMTNASNLQVTFSKRRTGLFKKASELCTLCGAEVALVVFSPVEKSFCFGHPNVDGVIDRYLTGGPPQNIEIMQFMEAYRTAKVCELNTQLIDMNNELDNERKCSKELNHLHKKTQAQFRWACPIEDMNTTELEQFKFALEELKKHVSSHTDRRLTTQTASNPTHQFLAATGGASSSNNPVFQPPPQPQMPIQPSMLQQSLIFYAETMMMRHHGFNIGGNGNLGFF